MAASFLALFEQLVPQAEAHPGPTSRPRPATPAFGPLAELLGAPTPVAAREKPIVLIACSDTKIDTKGRKVPAADLYASTLFRKSLQYARAVAPEQNIRILSGLYGVIPTDRKIATYDHPISKLTLSELEHWGHLAQTALLQEFGRAPREVIILAGDEYIRALGGVTNNWTAVYPFGTERGHRMKIGERLHWLNEQLRAQGIEPHGAPEKEKPLKPGRVRMNTRGRPWRTVEALAWEGDLFVHVDLGDDELFTITHAPTGRALEQRFHDERLAKVYARELNDPAVRPVFDSLVEAVEKKHARHIVAGILDRLARLLKEREPALRAEYRRRFGQDPPRDALAPVSRREVQEPLSQRTPAADAPVAPVVISPTRVEVPRFADLAQLLGGAGPAPGAAPTPVPSSVAEPSKKATPTSEAWSYLGTVGGYMVWPDVGTRVRWTEEAKERRGKVVRPGTREFTGTITRLTVDEMNPRDIDVWARPDGGGEERRIGIGGIRIPTAALPAFVERAKDWFAKRMKAQSGESPMSPRPVPPPAETERRQVVQFLRTRASRFSSVWPVPGQVVSATNRRIADALRKEATAIERAPAAEGQTAREARAAALGHLRSVAAKVKGKAGEAIFVAANDIEGGMHLGLEQEEPASSAPDPRKFVEAMTRYRPAPVAPSVPSFADLVTSLGATAPTAPRSASPASEPSPRSSVGPELATVRVQDGTSREVVVLGRDGDFIVHADLVTPTHFALTHTKTNRKVAEFDSREEALAVAMDLNRPEVRPLFERHAAGDESAAVPLGRVLQNLAPGRMERWRVAEEARQLEAARPRRGQADGTRPEERERLVAYLRREAANAKRERAHVAAQRFGAIAGEIEHMAEPDAGLRHHAIERLTEHALLKTAEEVREGEHLKAAEARGERRTPTPAPGGRLRERIVEAVRVQSHSAEVLAGILGAYLATVRKELAEAEAAGLVERAVVPREGPPEYRATPSPATAAPPGPPAPAPAATTAPVQAPPPQPEPSDALRLVLPALPATANELRWRVLQEILNRWAQAEEIATWLGADLRQVRDVLLDLRAGQYVERTRDLTTGIVQYRADIEAVMRKRKGRERDLQGGAPHPIALARVGGGQLLIEPASVSPGTWIVRELNQHGHDVLRTQPLAWADAVAAAVARDGDPRCASNLPTIAEVNRSPAEQDIAAALRRAGQDPALAERVYVAGFRASDVDAWAAEPNGATEKLVSLGYLPAPEPAAPALPPPARAEAGEAPTPAFWRTVPGGLDRRARALAQAADLLTRTEREHRTAESEVERVRSWGEATDVEVAEVESMARGQDVEGAMAIDFALRADKPAADDLKSMAGLADAKGAKLLGDYLRDAAALLAPPPAAPKALPAAAPPPAQRGGQRPVAPPTAPTPPPAAPTAVPAVPDALRNVNSVAAIRRIPIGTRFKQTANVRGPIQHPTVRTLIAVTPRHADFRIEDPSDSKNGEVSRAVLKGVTVHSRPGGGFALTSGHQVLAEYAYEPPPKPALDFFTLPLPMGLRLVKEGTRERDSRRVLVDVKEATRLQERTGGGWERVVTGTMLGLRVDDLSDKRHGSVEWVYVDPSTIIAARPNGFALMREGDLVGDYRFEEAAPAPPSTGAWERALSAHEEEERKQARARLSLAHDQAREWRAEAEDALRNIESWAAQSPPPIDAARRIAEARQSAADARALYSAASFRALPPETLERLIEAVPHVGEDEDDDDANDRTKKFRRLWEALVEAREQGAYGVPSGQYSLLGGLDVARPGAPAAPPSPPSPGGPAAPAAPASPGRPETPAPPPTALTFKVGDEVVGAGGGPGGVVVDARADGHIIVEHDDGERTPWTHPAWWLPAVEARPPQQGEALAPPPSAAARVPSPGGAPAVDGAPAVRVPSPGRAPAVRVPSPSPPSGASAVRVPSPFPPSPPSVTAVPPPAPSEPPSGPTFGDLAAALNESASVPAAETEAEDVAEAKAPEAEDEDDVAENLSVVEHRTAAKRRDANIKAMWLAYELEQHPRPLTGEDRLVLAAYSDWGGIGIRKSLAKFPPGFPVPEARQLIHAYFTPPAVTNEIARVVRPLLAELTSSDGHVHALEPSVGIGRFPLAFSGPGFETVTWHCVEYSELSYKMLHALRPEMDLYLGPFERWVAEHGEDFAGRLKLVVSNPPYGERNFALTDDPDRSYRYKRSDQYFLRRSLDLLGPGGLGVYIIPSGFLTGNDKSGHARKLREEVLRRHHLSAAFRLPNEVFSLANVVTDVLFFRARGTTLDAVDPSDSFILDGRYYEEFPSHILGTVVRNEPGKRQWHTSAEGYTVVGEFKGLPAVLEERPMCVSCMHAVVSGPTEPPPAARGAEAKVLEAQALAGDDERLATAAALGRRVEAYLASVANPDLEPVGWEELNGDLLQWAALSGAPALDAGVLAMTQAERGPLGKGPPGGAGWLLKAFVGKTTTLIEPLASKPHWMPRFIGNPDDPLQVGEYLFRANKRLAIDELPGKDPTPLFAAGWCEDAPDDGAWTEDLGVRGWLFPPDEYLFGELWPKFDRAQARGKLGDAQVAAQASRLLEIIQPQTFDEIEVTPQDGFVPIDMLSEWLATLNHNEPAKLVRDKGIVRLADVAFEDHDRHLSSLAHDALLCLGWINHDYVVFQPYAGEGERMDEIRLELATEWTQRFRAWLEAEPERSRVIERKYQRARQGFRAHGYGSAPLKLARWSPAIVLNPHQIAGARRIDANRGGGLGFDVGVGKTFTILASLALARQGGRARRPVIVVPQPIAFQWVTNVARALPDFRVVVIGINKRTITRGLRQGAETSETDTPEERARKWARFMGGEFDVAILTYDSLPRTQMDRESTLKFIEGVTAIEREVEIRRRNAAREAKGRQRRYEERKDKLERKLERAEEAERKRADEKNQWGYTRTKQKGEPAKIRAELAELERSHKEASLTERQDAVLTEGVGAWLAEMLELPAAWKPDPDIIWNKIGVDWIAFDEAHNGKNLHMPSSREGGAVPKFMGNEGEGSKRAWHWFFRCCDVQSRGGEIILATATPASNSPVEIYNLVKYVDKDAWARIGIYDPEAFIDRFCLLEPQEVLNSEMETETRLACVGFKNLDELRSVVFKFWEFKTAKQANLKLPKAIPDRVFVDMNAAQEAKYETYIAEIEEALKNPREGSHKILGLLARMAMVAMHPQLDEKFDWKSAHLVDSPHSPKFDKLAEKVVAAPGCGHIVFADYIAAHAWIRDVLIEAGISADRIGVLNAVTAPSAADRQRTAREFNGDPEAGIPPRYDVLIANAIGEEGVDLQLRTCEIHHLDIGWTPKKTEQRNGRGVRQGNTLSNVRIWYYIANRSQDGTRLDMVRGKQNWISSLLEGKDNVIANPAAESTLSRKDLLVLISRDPEKTRARFEEAEREREEERKKKVAKNASDTLRAVANRFERARGEHDATVAAELLSQARQKLAGLAKVPPDVWPWGAWAQAAEHVPMLVPKEGGPVYEGLRVAMPKMLDRTVIEYAEFGRIDEKSIGTRFGGAAHWEQIDLNEVVKLHLEPQMRIAEGSGTYWPADDQEKIDQEMRDQWLFRFRHGDGAADAWEKLGWPHATNAFAAEQWARWGGEIVKAIASTGGWAQNILVPALRGERLVLGLTPPFNAALPPTDEGYSEFLQRAPASGLKFTDLERAAVFWWNRGIPRNLLSAARGAEQEAPPTSGAAPAAPPASQSLGPATTLTPSAQAPASPAPLSVARELGAGAVTPTSNRVVRFSLPRESLQDLLRGHPENRDALRNIDWSDDDDEDVVLTQRLSPDQAAAVRDVILSAEGAVELDASDDYVFGVTNAPPDYDGFGTLTLGATANAERRVAIRKEHFAWQEGRYASGLRRFRSEERQAPQAPQASQGSPAPQVPEVPQVQPPRLPKAKPPAGGSTAAPAVEGVPAPVAKPPPWVVVRPPSPSAVATASPAVRLPSPAPAARAPSPTPTAEAPAVRVPAPASATISAARSAVRVPSPASTPEAPVVRVPPPVRARPGGSYDLGDRVITTTLVDYQPEEPSGRSPTPASSLPVWNRFTGAADVQLRDLERYDADFSVVLRRLFEEQVRSDVPQVLRVRSIRLSPTLLEQARTATEGDWDDRGADYVADLASAIERAVPLPPIVVRGDHLLDGKRRVLAADQEGLEAVPAIDLAEFELGRVDEPAASESAPLDGEAEIAAVLHSAGYDQPGAARALRTHGWTATLARQRLRTPPHEPSSLVQTLKRLGFEPTRTLAPSPGDAGAPAVSSAERPNGRYWKVQTAPGGEWVWGIRLTGPRPGAGERVKVETAKGKVKVETVADVVKEAEGFFFCTIVEKERSPAAA